jgi:hypothetical protein
MKVQLHDLAVSETMTRQAGTWLQLPLISGDDLYWFNEGCMRGFTKSFVRTLRKTRGVNGTHTLPCGRRMQTKCSSWETSMDGANRSIH